MNNKFFSRRTQMVLLEALEAAFTHGNNGPIDRWWFAHDELSIHVLQAFQVLNWNWGGIVHAMITNRFPISESGEVLETSDYDLRIGKTLKLMSEILLQENLRDVRNKVIVDQKKKLMDFLESDGWHWDGKRLVRIDQGDMNIEEILTPLWQCIRASGLLTQKEVEKHLGDAETAWNEGRWKEAAQDYRLAFEAALDGCALEQELNDPLGRKVTQAKGQATRPAAVRQYLQDAGFFSRGEKVCADGIYSIASNFGGYYGLIDVSEARVVRGIVIAMLSWIVERWEAWKKNGYKQS